jgi:IS30 family transposase
MESTYRHLTLEERRTLFRLQGAKLPINEIASQLGPHRCTIYREIARNEFREVRQYRGYYPVTAEDSARRRRRRQRKLVRDAHLRGHVVEKLRLW